MMKSKLHRARVAASAMALATTLALPGLAGAESKNPIVTTIDGVSKAITDILNNRLKECKGTAILPPDEDGSAQAGAGLSCPQTTTSTLPNPACTRHASIKFKGDIMGAVNQDTIFTIDTAVKANSNESVVHNHQTMCATASSCAASYKDWVVDLDTTLAVKVQITIGGKFFNADVSTDFGGENQHHRYSRTKTHPTPRNCGPET